IFACAVVLLARTATITVALWGLVAPAINAAVFLLQRFHVWNPIRFTEDIPEHFRYTALIGNPDDAASFFVAPLIAAIALLLVTRGWRRAFAALAFATLAAAVMTGRLTSIIAVADGLLVLAIAGIVARAQRAAGRDEHSAFARVAALPLAIALGVLCLAHFPLHLTAPALMFVYFGALAYGWSGNAPEVVDTPRVP